MNRWEIMETEYDNWFWKWRGTRYEDALQVVYTD
jgi:hypothetical protein